MKRKTAAFCSHTLLILVVVLVLAPVQPAQAAAAHTEYSRQRSDEHCERVAIVASRAGADKPSQLRARLLCERVRVVGTFTNQVNAALAWFAAHEPDVLPIMLTYVDGFGLAATVAAYALEDFDDNNPYIMVSCEVFLGPWALRDFEHTLTSLYHETMHCYAGGVLGLKRDPAEHYFVYGEDIAFMKRHGLSIEDLPFYEQVRASFAPDHEVVHCYAGGALGLKRDPAAH